MGNVSTEWLAAISTGRDYSIDEKKKGCAVPVTPWLHPPVGKRLRDLITKLGTVRELERQEILYPQGRKVSDIVLVQQGVTARHFGNAVSGPKAAAISTPGHFACGNLNFLTRRPSLGTYFALNEGPSRRMPEGSFAAGPFYGSGTVCLYHPIIGKLHALGPSRFCADGICPCGPSSEGLCGDVGDSLRQALCRRLYQVSYSSDTK